MNRSELKRRRKIDGKLRGFIHVRTYTQPYRSGYSSHAQKIREIVQDIPEWVRKNFDWIHRDSAGQHFVSRHGTNYRVDLLQTPGFNRAAKIAYTRNLQRAAKRARRMNAAVPA